MQRIATLTLAVVAVLLSASPALAGPPTKFLQAQVAAVRTGLAEQVDLKNTEQVRLRDGRLMALIDPLMEFEQLSERALQKHWPSLPEAKRGQFTSLFRELVFRSYLKKVRSANEGYTLAYEDEEAKGRREAAVTVIAKTKKAEIELVFHMVARKGRRFVAEDVIIDEVSLVANYREQFNKIIAKDGFDALIGKMKKKLGELGGDPLPPLVKAASTAAPTAAPTSAAPASAAPAAPASSASK
jgi:phospholipid transport system substrate-binding protein